MNNPDLYSPRELAEISGWPERRIRNLLRSGQLRHVRVGASYLLPRSAIAEYVERNMIEPSSSSGSEIRNLRSRTKENENG
ncbi:helix-turn-helix domain-containing protein [Cognatishimia sp. 1_MG-2023]|uniref:helix-turn-helix domain-containing protein n=1 Tax=Cognatishimia sp. 1_MG-2023 TaxID=3062642 RepID=UPI0034A15078